MPFAHDQTPDKPRRRALRASSWVIAVALALAAVVILMSVTHVSLQHREAVAQARRNAENFSRMLSAHMRLAVQSVDQFLVGSAIALRMAPGGLDSRSDELSTYLHRSRAVSHISGLVVLDAAGRVVHADEPAFAEPLDQSEGRVFRAHAAASTRSGPIIHAPLRVGDGGVLLPISRSLFAADDSFAGVLVALVDASHFAYLFRSIDLGPSGAISLIDADSTLVARWPATPIAGRRIPRRSGVREAVDQGRTSGVSLEETPIDGARRMVAWQSVEATPLVVVAAIGEADFLANWHRDTGTEITRAAIRVLVIVIVAILFCWLLRRAESAHQRLAEREARFRDFATASSDWYWEQDENLRFTVMSDGNQAISGLAAQAHFGKTRRETNPLGVSEAQWAAHDADLAARRPFRDFRIQRIDANGALKHLSINGVPVFDESGVFRGYRGTGKDVSSEVEALAMLQDTLHLTQAVIDAVPSMINAKDPDGRYILMNAYQARTFGTTPDSVIGRTAADLVDGPIADQANAIERSLIETREATGYYQIRFAGADGVERDWLTNKLPVLDAEGRVRFVVSNSIDISDRVRAEQQFLRTQQLLQAVIDAIPGMINAKGPDGRYILINAFQARLFGKNPDSVIGQTAADLFAPDHAESIAVLERRLVETRQGTGFFQERFAGQDGVERDWLTNKLPVMDAEGRVQFVLSNSIDISDRVRAEQQLMHTQQLLQAVINAIPGMINAKDTAGRYVMMSSYQARLYGTTPEDAIGKTAADLLGSEYGGYTGAIDAKVAATGQSTGFYEEQYGTADGVTRDWLTAKLPLFDAQGAVRLIITVALDISERKEAERSLLQAQEDLQRASDAAVRANHAKSSFLANMSHELRTPLNAIIGFSEIMKLGIFGPLGSPRYVEYVGDIFSSAQHLLSLISDLLDMAKIEAGKRELALESVDSAAEISETLRMLDGRAQSGGVTVSVEDADGPPILRVDRRAFRQVLLNIIGNAVKFTQPGGSVMVRYESRQDGAAIIVADDGPGIPEDQLEQLGTPFHQAHGSSYTANEGTGLGLALSRSLVELHGGKLSIESTEGLGTTVTMIFPVLPEPEELQIEQRSAA